MSKRILLTVGSTPRVITEALYLWKLLDGVAFDEIHVVTTDEGRDRIQRELLGRGGRGSALARACRRLGIDRDDISFNVRTIHVTEGDDPGHIADLVLATARRLCGPPDDRVVAVFGASDTSDALWLAFSLQLAGRPCDEFFRIREHPALTTAIGRGRVRDFQYPSADLQVGATRIPKADLVTRDRIPLVPCSRRDRAANLLSYRQIAAMAKRELQLLSDPAVLSIDLSRRTLRIDHVFPRLTPTQFFWYVYLARLAPKRFSLRNVTHALITGAADTPFSEIADITTFYVRLFPHRRDEWPAILRRACGPEPGLPATIAKINAALRSALGGGAERYLIRGALGTGSYGLTLDPSRIRFHLEARATARPLASEAVSR